jgi:hypothetical protein
LPDTPSSPEEEEESTMNDEHGVHETKGVTVKLLSTVDLGPEIEGMAGDSFG